MIARLTEVWGTGKLGIIGPTHGVENHLRLLLVSSSWLVHTHRSLLKTLDTIGNCQRQVFTLGVSYA